MKQSNKSQAEDLLAIHLSELKLKFIRQVPVCADRKWKWDFAITSVHSSVLFPNREVESKYHAVRIAIEVDGYFKGRHGAGWGADNEKRNTGQMLGWRVLVFSTKDVLNGTAKEFIKSWL